MKVKAIKSYYDLQQHKAVKVGDEFEVSAERAKELTTAGNKAGYALCEVVEENEPAKPVKKGKAAKEEG